mgnify:FL=1
MYEIQRNIFVDEVIYKKEYDFVYGTRKDESVIFQYYNQKQDREGKEIEFDSYSEALAFARYREGDRRYRNYEFLIFAKGTNYEKILG